MIVAPAKRPRSVGAARGSGARGLVLFLFRYGMFVALAIWLVAMSLAAEHFFSATNFLNVARQAAPIIIVAVGMTFVMATAGIDLSVGSTVALVSVLSAAWLAAGLDWWLVMPAIILVGAALGALNGAFVWLGLPPFVVTLATLVSFRGLAFVYTDGYQIPVADPAFLWLGRGEIFSVGTPIVIALVVAALGWLVLARTRFGLHALATGGREEPARLMGIGIGRIKLMVYAMTGALAALTGMVYTARLGNGSPNSGMMLELDAIAAAVLGGTSLFGGHATIAGTIAGALFLNFIRNGLNLMQVSAYWVQVVTGLVLLAAVLLNLVVNRRIERWAQAATVEDRA